MKLLHLSILSIALVLSGCASPDYAAYSKAQTDIEVSKNLALSAKYKAMEAIASSGDATAKVAAVMALSIGSQGGSSQGSSLSAPMPNQALQWASVLVPGVTQVLGMRYNYLTQVTQSNNSAAVAQSTNASFVGIAGKIQATNTNTTNTVLSGTGSLGTGTYTTTDNTSTPTVVNPVVVMQPDPVIVDPTVVNPMVVNPVVIK